jgi:hypothetical protein
MSALNRRMIILLVPGPHEGRAWFIEHPTQPALPSLLAQVTPSQRCADPLAAILGGRE